MQGASTGRAFEQQAARAARDFPFVEIMKHFEHRN
jgi:hypothetical protein